jgi:hypothetical protein
MHDVTGVPFETWHGGEVQRVVSFRLNGSTHGRFVLVHLTAAGQVTDYDVVSD